MLLRDNYREFEKSSFDKSIKTFVFENKLFFLEIFLFLQQDLVSEKNRVQADVLWLENQSRCEELSDIQWKPELRSVPEIWVVELIWKLDLKYKIWATIKKYETTKIDLRDSILKLEIQPTSGVM